MAHFTVIVRRRPAQLGQRIECSWDDQLCWQNQASWWPVAGYQPPPVQTVNTGYQPTPGGGNGQGGSTPTPPAQTPVSAATTLPGANEPAPSIWDTTVPTETAWLIGGGIVFIVLVSFLKR